MDCRILNQGTHKDHTGSDYYFLIQIFANSKGFGVSANLTAACQQCDGSVFRPKPFWIGSAK